MCNIVLQMSRMFRLLALFILLSIASFFAEAGERKDDSKLMLVGVPDIINEAMSGSPLAILESSVRKVYKSIGIDIKFVYAPAKRIRSMAKTGFVDAEIIRDGSYSQQVEDMIKIPVPIYTGGVYAISLASNNIDLNADQLTALKLACLRGVIMTDIFCRSDRSRIEANSVRQLMDLLDNERVHVIFLFSGLMRDDVLGNKKYKVHAPPLISFTGYHYVNRKNQQIIPELTAAFGAEFRHSD